MKMLITWPKANETECDCDTAFDYFENNSLTVLVAGNLVSENCQIDEYVIDWHHEFEDNPIAFTSGKGTDPSILVYHPMTGDASLPVEPGLWIPKIRYIVVGGERIYATPRPGYDYCNLPAINVLPPVTVLPVNCSTNLNPSGNYNFGLYYKVTDDFRQATRQFRYYLSDDGLTRYLAVYFFGYIVEDQVEAYYNDEETPLMKFLCGSSLSNNQVTDPPRVGASSFKTVIDLTGRTYSAGDYILVKIKASPLSGIQNTEWNIYLRCLPVTTWECNLFNEAIRNILVDQIYMWYDEANCQYRVRVKMEDYIPSNDGTFNLLNYFNIIYSVSSGTILRSSSPAYFELSLSWRISGGASNLLSQNIYTDTQAFYSVTKSGNTLTFTFSNQSDFDAFANSYNSQYNHANMANYTDDQESVNHYKFFIVQLRQTQFGCGDQYTQRNYYFHRNSQVTLSYPTITINMVNTTNGYPDPTEPCDFVKTNVNTPINSVAQTLNMADHSWSSNCRNVNPFSGFIVTRSVLKQMVSDYSARYHHNVQQIMTVCSWPKWCWYSNAWSFILFYLRVNITDENDPINNFRITSFLNYQTGCVDLANPTVIYEKVNGQQIIP